MGLNQDQGSYEFDVLTEDDFIYIQDVYSSVGTVTVTLTIYSWDEDGHIVLQSSITTTTVAIVDMADITWQGEAAKTVTVEIDVDSGDELILELYKIAAARIGFSEFQMTPNNTAKFNETFAGEFDELWYQDDFAGNFGDNPGSLTSTTFYPLGYHAGATGADFAHMLAAAFTAFNMLTEPDVYVNFGLFFDGYYRTRFWVHSSVGWIECRIGTENISETALEPVLLADTLRLSGSNLYSVYVSGYEMATDIPAASFDGVIDGIAILDIYNNINV